MNEGFPYTKEEWLKLRDDRPNRIPGVKTTNNSSFFTKINVDSEFIKSKSGQWTTALTVLQLSRWIGGIVLLIDDAPLLIGHTTHKSLNDLLRDLVESSDPFCEIHFNEADRFSEYVEIYLGRQSKDKMWFDQLGWYVGFGNSASDKSPNAKLFEDNIMASAYCASIVNSELYKIAIGTESILNAECWFSLWDYSVHSTTNALEVIQKHDHQLNLADFIQIGAGAVGSCFDLLLGWSDYKGSGTIIDFDPIGIENLPTALGFTAKNAIQKDQKITVVKGLFKAKNWDITTFEGSFYEYYCKNGRDFKEIVLCLANEQNLWTLLQENYPPVVLHATTSSNWSINLGRHIPIQEWCIVCRFKDDIGGKNVMRCEDIKEVAVEKDVKVFGALPFLSLGAAAILLTELVKLHINPVIFKTSNFIKLYYSNYQFSKLSFRKPLKDCPICRLQYPQLSNKYLLFSKFWHLSEAFKSGI